MMPMHANLEPFHAPPIVSSIQCLAIESLTRLMQIASPTGNRHVRCDLADPEEWCNKFHLVVHGESGDFNGEKFDRFSDNCTCDVPANGFAYTAHVNHISIYSYLKI